MTFFFFSSYHNNHIMFLRQSCQGRNVAHAPCIMVFVLHLESDHHRGTLSLPIWKSSVRLCQTRATRNGSEIESVSARDDTIDINGRQRQRRQTHIHPIMKVNVSDEEWKLLDSVVLRGALEGAVASAAVAVPSFYYLHRKSAWYRSLPLPLRVAGVVMVVAPFTSIQAERRSLEFERKRWCVCVPCGALISMLTYRGTGRIPENWSWIALQRQKRPGSAHFPRRTRRSTGLLDISIPSFSGVGQCPWPRLVPSWQRTSE